MQDGGSLKSYCNLYFKKVFFLNQMGYMDPFGVLVRVNSTQNQGNLLVLRFSKHPLHVQFDQVLAEIFGVKDTCYHSFIFMIFDLLEMKIKEI